MRVQADFFRNAREVEVVIDKLQHGSLGRHFLENDAHFKVHLLTIKIWWNFVHYAMQHN